MKDENLQDHRAGNHAAKYAAITSYDSCTFSRTGPRAIFCNKDQKFYIEKRPEWSASHIVFPFYTGLQEKHFRLLLRGEGVDAKIPDDETLSPLDATVNEIVQEHRVAEADKIAGYPPGVVMSENEKILITERAPLLRPVHGDFSFLNELLKGRLVSDPGDEVQYQVFMAWLADYVRCLYDFRRTNGMVITLAGERDCGKSLLVAIVEAMCGGTRSLPFSHLVGDDKHNSEIFTSSTWVVDDENHHKDAKGREKLTAAFKKLVANSKFRRRAMHQAGNTIESLVRVMICVNNEPEQLKVLPHMDPGTEDKFLILKVHRYLYPWFDEETGDPTAPVETVFPEQRETYFNRIKADLPHLIYHLLYDHETPENLKGRFGVKAYHHPEIMSQLHEISKEGRLWQIIERVIFPEGADTPLGVDPFIKLTSTQLKSRLLDSGRLTRFEEDFCAKQNDRSIGSMLNKLEEIYPDRIENAKSGNNRYRRFFPPKAC